MSEAKKFVSYWNAAEGINLFFEEDKSIIEELTYRSHNKIYEFERPDFFIEFESMVMLVEHFSFDSAKRIKKGGSLLKIEESQKEKEYLAYVDEQHSKGVKDVSYSGTYKTKISFDNYEKNLLRSFNEHLKFKEYIENFKKKNTINKIIECGICIENTSILPDAVHKGLESFVVLPIHSLKFLEALSQQPEIKHVFLMQRGDMTKRHVFYFSNTEEHIEKLKNGKIIDETYNFIDWKPHTLGFSSIIPKE